MLSSEIIFIINPTTQLTMLIPNLLQKQIIRFILMGIMNTIFGYLVFSLLVFLKFNATTAIITSTILGLIFNFNTLGRYVFNKTDKNLILKFISSYFLLMIFNICLQKTLHFFIYSDYISGLISIIITAGLSYIMNKFYVFK